MRRVLVGIVVGLAMGRPATAAPGCIDASAAHEKVARMDAANARRLAAALAKRGVSRVALTSRRMENHGRMPFQDGDVHGRELWFSYDEPCSMNAADAFAFVIDRRGRVFRLIEERRERQTTFTACGCEPDRGGCGVAPQPLILAFTLPARSRYGGDLHVPYVYEDGRVFYAGEGKAACPRRDPPP